MSPGNIENSQRSRTKNAVGWSYDLIKWFSEEESQAAKKSRQALLNQLSDQVKQTANGSKLFTGQLSPGCQICVDGTWGCCFIGFACTRNCFFCPNAYLKEKNRPATSHGKVLESSEMHVQRIKQFGIKGVAFSGGEPLLYLDRILDHTHAIRQAFGDQIYIWLYTNGDLVQEDTLKALVQAGINEIRFDLTARNYDLTPLKLARRIVPTVSVEIPIIPEDEQTIISLLPQLLSMGIDHFNMHQLIANHVNFINLSQRNYHFLHGDIVTIFESEMSALRILKFALDKNMDIPINYCSGIYKQNFQNSGFRHQFLNTLPEAASSASDIGYVRYLNITGKEKDICKLISQLREEGIDESLWQVDALKHEVWLPVYLYKFINWEDLIVRLYYFDPEFPNDEDEDKKSVQSIVDSYNRTFITDPLSFFVFEQWYKFYVSGVQSERQLRENFAKYYPVTDRQSLTDMTRYQNLILYGLKTFEETNSGLQAIF